MSDPIVSLPYPAPHRQFRFPWMLVDEHCIGALSGPDRLQVSMLSRHVAVAVQEGREAVRGVRPPVAPHRSASAGLQADLHEDGEVPVIDQLGPMQEDAIEQQDRIRGSELFSRIDWAVQAMVEDRSPIPKRPARPQRLQQGDSYRIQVDESK
jgi:hypothetical protein